MNALRAWVTGIVIATSTLATGASASEGRGTVGKEARELVVVSELSKHGMDQYRWLYRFLEVNAVSLAQRKLGDAYRRVVVVAGERASLDGFAGSLATLTGDAQIQAIDVLVNLHGGPGKLYFHEDGYATSTLRDRVTAAAASTAKLRTLYSSACYGASHTKDFLATGFKAAGGALRVNTNGGFEYPTLLTAWRHGDTFAEAHRKGGNEFFRRMSDDLAKSRGFGDADSRKVVDGRGELTIASAVTTP